MKHKHKIFLYPKCQNNCPSTKYTSKLQAGSAKGKTVAESECLQWSRWWTSVQIVSLFSKARMIKVIVMIGLLVIPQVSCFFYLNETENVQTWLKNITHIGKAWENYTYFCIMKIQDDIPHTPITLYHNLFKCLQGRKIVCHTKVSQHRRVVWFQKRRILRSFGKECLWVRYAGRQIEFSVNQRLYQVDRNSRRFVVHQSHRGNEPLHEYRFVGNKAALLGFNITYTTFSLSGMCPESHNSRGGQMRDREFVVMVGCNSVDPQTGTCRSNSKFPDLKYCQQRPQFSVFTGFITYIYYSACVQCDNIRSDLQFEFQLMQADLVRNYKEQYYMAIGIISSHKHSLINSCVFNIINYSAHTMLLRVKIFQMINIFVELPYKATNAYWKAFLLDSTNINRAKTLLLKYQKVPFYQCMLQIILKNEEPFHLSTGPTQLSVLTEAKGMIQFSAVNAQVTRTLVPSEKQYVTHCSVKSGLVWQKLQMFQSPEDTFINLTLDSILFSGSNSVDCHFGGVSFLQTFVEITRMCSYITQMHRQNFSFVSTSNETLVVIYLEGKAELNASFYLSTGVCQGIFVNPCVNKEFHQSHPFRGTAWKAGGVFPVKYQYSLWKYDFPFERPEGNCLAIQMSLFFFEDVFFKTYNALVSGYVRTKGHTTQGCLRTFLIQPCRGEGQWVQKCRGMWNGAHIKLTQFVALPATNPLQKHRYQHSDSSMPGLSNPHSTEAIGKACEGPSFCRENLRDVDSLSECVVKHKQKWTLRQCFVRPIKNTELFKRLRFYKTQPAEFTHTTGMSSFCINMTLMQAQDLSNDVFSLSVAPFSKSVVLLIMSFTTGELANSVFMWHPGIRENPLCLRILQRSLIDSRYKIGLKLHSDNSHMGYDIGSIVINTILCLSKKGHLSQLYNVKAKYLMRTTKYQMCVDEKRNKGEDQLIWRSKLNSKIFANVDWVRIHLPGKITNAQLSTKETSENISLQIQWFLTREMEIAMKQKQNGANFIKSNWSTIDSASCISNVVLSQRFHADYQQTSPRSWFEARKMCQDVQGKLPSITSHKELTCLISTLKQLAFTTFITHFFIGLRQHVKYCSFSQCFFLPNQLWNHTSIKIKTTLCLSRRITLGDGLMGDPVQCTRGTIPFHHKNSLGYLVWCWISWREMSNLFQSQMVSIWCWLFLCLTGYMIPTIVFFLQQV